MNNRTRKMPAILTAALAAVITVGAALPAYAATTTLTLTPTKSSKCVSLACSTALTKWTFRAALSQQAETITSRDRVFSGNSTAGPLLLDTTIVTSRSNENVYTWSVPPSHQYTMMHAREDVSFRWTVNGVPNVVSTAKAVTDMGVSG